MKELNQKKFRVISCALENCGRTFRTRYLLRKHIEEDHLVFSRNDCTDCKKMCETRRSYREHIGVHKSDGTRSCFVCQDYLSQLRNFTVHTKNNDAGVQASAEEPQPKPVFNLMEMAIRKLMGK